MTDSASTVQMSLTSRFQQSRSGVTTVDEPRHADQSYGKAFGS